MATVTPTVLQLEGFGDAITYTYTNMANGDVGAPIAAAQWADRTVQVFGTFGAGGTLTVQGSNDGGTTWATVNDPSSTALTATAAKVKSVLEITRQLRPNITAGDGTTSLTVVILVRRPQPMRNS